LERETQLCRELRFVGLREPARLVFHLLKLLQQSLRIDASSPRSDHSLFSYNSASRPALLISHRSKSTAK